MVTKGSLLFLILYNPLNHLEIFAFVCYGNELRKMVKLDS